MIRAIIADHSWDLSIGTVTQWFGYGVLRDVLGDLMSQVVFDGPLQEDVGDPGDLCFITLPWPGMNKKPYERMQRLIDKASEKTRFIVLCDDRYMLKAASKVFGGRQIKLALVTNFKKAPLVWEGCPADRIIYYPKYPWDKMANPSARVLPKFDVGYLGRMIGSRLTILKKLDTKDLRIICMGSGWNRQDHLEYIRAEAGGCYWQQLPEMIGLARWHLSVQDSGQAEMLPAVARFGDCWRSGRPVMIHESHLAGRPDINWEFYEEFIVRDSSDVARLSKKDPWEAYQLQVMALMSEYYEGSAQEAGLASLKEFCGCK